MQKKIYVLMILMLIGKFGFSDRPITYEAHSKEMCGIFHVEYIPLRDGYVMFCCKCREPLIQVKLCRYGLPETTECVCPNTVPFNNTFTENEISTEDEQSNTSVRINTDCPPSTSINDDDEAEVNIFAEIEIKLSELQKELRELKKSPPINCECVSTAAIVMICLMLFIGPFVALISYHGSCPWIIQKLCNLSSGSKKESFDAVNTSNVICHNGEQKEAERKQGEAKPKQKSTRRDKNSRRK
uniref:uncharacterized protein LOC120347226 isoform X2 n=1 Tax=Styela clava TaxID=7725 RepID=UPI00193926C2|nr:uncharacterized protein LOC120347226 isoform X2 [Styela clava]